jgi:hypothetical protein
MNFTALAKQILKSESLLPRRTWPDQIEIPAQKSSGLFGFGGQNLFWEQITNLRKFTDSETDKFSQDYQGSTGWEYLTQIIQIDNQVFYSPVSSSRSYTSVNSANLAIKITTTQPAPDAVSDTFMLNQTKLATFTYTGKAEVQRRNRIIETGEFVYGFIAGIHSHPKQQIAGIDKYLYSFYSPQDLKALFFGRQHMQGLVTDCLWLICKTQESIMPSDYALEGVYLKELEDKAVFEQAAADMVSRHEMVLYRGDFGDGSLVRVA